MLSLAQSREPELLDERPARQSRSATPADPTLWELYESHRGKVSDKWMLYLSEYERLLAPRRPSVMRMLEIGVQNGGSLEIWARYFPELRRLVGCDINADCARLSFEDTRVSVVLGDANTDAVAKRITAHCERFDLVIDDGSHLSGDIVRSFCRYFDHVTDGGLYIVEDLHCSYWHSHEGGLFHPTSPMAFFKRLADVPNHEHWGVSRTRRDSLHLFLQAHGADIDEAMLSRVHSVEFINSMCVIRKDAPSANVLGQRFIAGREEPVVTGLVPLHLKEPIRTDEQFNPWARTKVEREKTLASALEACEQRCATLCEQLAQRECELAQVSATSDRALKTLDITRATGRGRHPTPRPAAIDQLEGDGAAAMAGTTGASGQARAATAVRRCGATPWCGPDGPFRSTDLSRVWFRRGRSCGCSFGSSCRAGHNKRRAALCALGRAL
jgi:predicted O-methyltransferase YrrM